MSEQAPGKTQLMKMMMAAVRGDRTAITNLIQMGLPKAREQIEQMEQEIQWHKNNDWDPDDARRMAMEGNVTPQMTAGAFSDIRQSVLKVLAFTPAALLARDEEEARAMEEVWVESAIELIVTLHNPTIKYAIIGGFRPEVREEVEEHVEAMAEETWEAVRALSQEEEINVDDFGKDTAAIIREVAKGVEMEQNNGGE